MTTKQIGNATYEMIIITIKTAIAAMIGYTMALIQGWLG